MKRFSRWIKNERINAEVYYLPYADALLQSLAAEHVLLLAIDGSKVGRNCLALMVSVIYKKRSLPVAGLSSEGAKGISLKRPTYGWWNESTRLYPREQE